MLIFATVIGTVMYCSLGKVTLRDSLYGLYSLMLHMITVEVKQKQEIYYTINIHLYVYMQYQKVNET